MTDLPFAIAVAKSIFGDSFLQTWCSLACGGKLSTASPSPHYAVLGPGRRLAGAPSRGRELFVIGCLSQCDTGQSLMPEAQRSTPDCEGCLKKWQPVAGFGKVSTATRPAVQPVPNQRSQASMQHHNALICNVICLSTQAHTQYQYLRCQIACNMARTPGVCPFSVRVDMGEPVEVLRLR